MFTIFVEGNHLLDFLCAFFSIVRFISLALGKKKTVFIMKSSPITNEHSSTNIYLKLFFKYLDQT